jgi:hypothetical protein
MAASITGITPAKGTIYGGQVVTITGAGFGASGTVTIDGRAATLSGAWSAASVQVVAPERSTAGVVNYAGGSVVVLLTAEDATTATTTYEYQSTQIERAVDSIASRLGAMSIQSGYNHTTTTAHVRAMREDMSIDTGAGWPQLIAFVSDGTTVTSEPYDFNKDTTQVVVQAVEPCRDPQRWRNDAFLLLSDIRRAVMRDRGNDGTSNTTDVVEWEIGKIMDNVAGTLAAASMTFSVEVQSVVNDMTTNTIFDSNLP